MPEGGFHLQTIYFISVSAYNTCCIGKHSPAAAVLYLYNINEGRNDDNVQIIR